MTPDRLRRRIGSAAIALLMLSVAPAVARNPLKIPDTQYEPMAWTQLEGWADDDHAAAFATFVKSCNVILKGTPSGPMQTGLYHVCQKAVVANPQKPGEARAFFEQNFRPVRLSPLGSAERDGFFTGYYEPIVAGTRTQTEGYDFPFYRKPGSLLSGGHMSVVGAAPPSEGKKKKKHAARRRLIPFYDRTAIEDGALAGRDLEICWLKDPIDNFFAQIQGSVRVMLDDGSAMRLNYAAANGQPYYAVGRWLIDKGIVAKDDMSMDRIREWMMQHPTEGQELRRRNKSYVFFRETKLAADDEPLGAQGISLTPGRSIAVDRKLHVYGTPFYISAYLPINGMKADTWFRRTMIAQDTGGAIVGPARADLYFGAGADAESVAGRMRHYGKFVMLTPRELVPSSDDEIPLPRSRPDVLISDDGPSDSPDAVADAQPEVAKPVAAAVPEPAPSPKVPLKPVPAIVSVPDEKKTAKAPDKSAEKTATKVADKTPEPVKAKQVEPASKVKSETAKPAKAKPVERSEKTKAEKVKAESAKPESIKPESIKPEHGVKTQAKAEPKAEAKTAPKTAAKPDKTKPKAEAKSSDKEKEWEARVMPVIPPQSSTPAQTPKSKTKG
jgi:membrane-bound lytic murein transglycosylase A